MAKNIFISSVLLIAFFIPWIDFTIFTLSGYDFPTSLDKLAILYSFLDASASADIFKISYFLYLFPLFSVFNIVRYISGYKNSYLINEYVFGLLATIFLFLIVKYTDTLSTSVFSIGFYLTFIFSLLGSISVTTNNAVEKKTNQYNEDTRESTIPEIDKPKLLEQLSLLHTLKEKGALTDEIYEQERQTILSILQKPAIHESPKQIDSLEQNISNSEEYQLEYEKLFGRETWLKRNKKWVIVLIVAIVGIITTLGIYNYYE